MLGGVREGPLTGGGRQLGSPVALRRTADDERDTKNIPRSVLKVSLAFPRCL